jgi:cytochrome c peroxidase
VIRMKQPQFVGDVLGSGFIDGRTIRYHLDAKSGAGAYDPVKGGCSCRFGPRMGPIAPVLERLDPLLQTPIHLADGEFNDLVSSLRDELLNDQVNPKNLSRAVPDTWQADVIA